MKRFFSTVAILGLLIPLSAGAKVPVQTFIKGSESTIYWVGLDGKRYVFPNYTTYRSWFMNPETGTIDLPQVQTLKDNQLADYALGGIVRERPGIRMVKIQTDPKVYALGDGGILQWIPTEAMAAALYGPDWNKKIDDIPVEFFAGYIIDVPVNCGITGETCTDAQNMSYSPQSEIGLVTNPDDDMRFRTNYRPTTQTSPYNGPQD